jgi:hypothetical protein
MILLKFSSPVTPLGSTFSSLWVPDWVPLFDSRRKGAPAPFAAIKEAFELSTGKVISGDVASTTRVSRRSPCRRALVTGPGWRRFGVQRTDFASASSPFSGGRNAWGICNEGELIGVADSQSRWSQFLGPVSTQTAPSPAGWGFCSERGRGAGCHETGLRLPAGSDRAFLRPRSVEPETSR